jgi:hypothetical protein
VIEGARKKVEEYDPEDAQVLELLGNSYLVH